ncbi:PfkB family carbohydrate kinase [Micromonospora sp. HM5-17]|jgi:fructokinase|uniref:PfkB family carbohydrate kinase n=1 Tax=Micromonospora sp. HM5-17 TaxID=2487710 RepID=UPI000F4860FA|nr:PfkB family carbohydrate kinase [Micromonospora sp. HM5-17]ROT29286.1 carbohydrate kinase [Micromonospora sp. HM5-17]
MRYAVVLGEALVDLLDGECAGVPVYRQAVGGAPLNVAVGVARLGGAVEFVGTLGDDVLAGRIRDLLTAAGVGQRGVREKAVATTLGVATFSGAEPDFRFYGTPPSYGLLEPEDLDVPLVAGAAVVYAGSIALLCPPVLAAARRAWTLATGWRVFDPNVRPRLLPDAAAVAEARAVVEEFASSADLVKLSVADAETLYGPDAPAVPGSGSAWPGTAGSDRFAEAVAERLRSLGAGTVVVTSGPRGALVSAGRDGAAQWLPAPVVEAVDATGAGDSVMAALIAELLAAGLPTDPSGWRERVRFALRVAGLVCESPGGAVAMPTRADVARRFPDAPDHR